ncbi:uncharacterized protein NPIL_335131 [Nephila pilipes]|uniref:Prokineticin domain-containing protein n=1 Tax=Nephila pilipes TaxID=299642 RepID=A0A8X6NHL5_NEPPI|nr:uncharacterized protein NPIL_335131 [Nephila pilipes]
MKFLIFAAVIVFVVVEVTAPPPPPPSRPPRPPKAKKCSSSEDCDAGECCVDDGFAFFRKGKCKKLATEGKSCNLEGELFHDRYMRHCPCVEGLTCEAEKKIEVPWEGEIRINERCVSPTSTSAEPEPETTVVPETEAPEPEPEAEE